MATVSQLRSTASTPDHRRRKPAEKAASQEFSGAGSRPTIPVGAASVPVSRVSVQTSHSVGIHAEPSSGDAKSSSMYSSVYRRKLSNASAGSPKAHRTDQQQQSHTTSTMDGAGTAASVGMRKSQQSGSRSMVLRQSDVNFGQFSSRPTSMIKSFGLSLLESYFFQGLMAFLTIFVLVGDDIRLLAFEKDIDPVFNVIAIVSLAFFTLELSLSCAVKEDYFPGFWFVMDTISTASLVFDITWVREALMGHAELTLDSTESMNVENGAVGQSEYARASRSSRVGTRVARLLRVIRLIQLSRLMKFFPYCFGNQQGDEAAAEPGEDVEEEEESRVGRKLGERTTQIVIILVLIMLVVLPQLHPGMDHIMMTVSAQYGADVVYKAWVDYEQEFLHNSSSTLLDPLRRSWEMELLMYIYYHNWHRDYLDNVQRSDQQDYAADWLTSLCFVGYLMNRAAGSDTLDNTKQGYIQALSPPNFTLDWDTLFSTGTSTGQWGDNLYVVGTLPDAVKQALKQPWSTDCSEESTVYGVSLLPDISCPRKTFRKEETQWYLATGTTLSFFRSHMQGQFVFVFDVRKRISWQSIMSILQTVFVIIILAIGAMLFSRDADSLVLFPIERMMSKVQLIRRNPLYAITMAEEKLAEVKRRQDKKSEYNAHVASHARSPMAVWTSVRNFFRRNRESDVQSPLQTRLRDKLRGMKKTRTGMLSQRQGMPVKGTMETHVLENVIIKLGSLLALGFGDAGTEIIRHNMDDDTLLVNAIVAGSRVDGVYGFCSIRNFTTAIEVLQEKTMVFVNQVAHIVHQVVDEHLGAANKNAGEAFLLVWRLSSYAHEHRSRIADLAVLSFIQVVVELSRDAQLSEYREHPALMAKLPDFRVALGFGLHLGWSIEGAIGSEFKIDASYLSPHVNLATLLEAESQQYGVDVLMSESLVSACSSLFRRQFRAIDHVKFQGSHHPIRLFTVDLNQEALPVDVHSFNRRKQKLTRDARDKMKAGKLSLNAVAHEAVFNEDSNVKRLRERYFLGFLQEFEKGYLNYEAGEWGVAAQVLRKTLGMLRRCSSNGLVPAEDGPSKVLIDFMESHNCQKPDGWPGFRELGESEWSAVNVHLVNKPKLSATESKFKLSVPRSSMQSSVTTLSKATASSAGVASTS